MLTEKRRYNLFIWALGLGYYISSNAAQTRTPQAWAYVVAACLLGLAFFLISLVLERLAMPWRARRDAAAP